MIAFRKCLTFLESYTSKCIHSNRQLHHKDKELANKPRVVTKWSTNGMKTAFWNAINKVNINRSVLRTIDSLFAQSNKLHLPTLSSSWFQNNNTRLGLEISMESHARSNSAMFPWIITSKIFCGKNCDLSNCIFAFQNPIVLGFFAWPKWNNFFFLQKIQKKDQKLFFEKKSQKKKMNWDFARFDFKQIAFD